MNGLELIVESKIKEISKSCKQLIYLFIKRTFDIFCSLLGVIMLIPISFIIKISYIFHKDFNSIFYTQERIGKDGKLFKLYKFRTMIPNADAVLNELLKDAKIKKEYKINKKLANDPRVTKMGKIIRKASIDEMPQFINVLLGNMSVIGNRPYLPRERKDMGKYYDNIIKTKPGITGYWQVSGRSDTSFKKRCKLESHYSDNQGLRLDMKIFLKTFKVVFLRKGAE